MCSVDFSFIFRDTIRYTRDNDCILLSCEIEAIQAKIEDLLVGRLLETIHIECIEPDFELILEPQYDISNSKDTVYVAPGHEIVDVTMQLRVNLWADDGLSDNFFSTKFGRDEIEIFNTYLKLVCGQISRNCDEIQALEKKSIIFYIG